jgi:hypothetical protein
VDGAGAKLLLTAFGTEVEPAGDKGVDEPGVKKDEELGE